MCCMRVKKRFDIFYILNITDIVSFFINEIVYNTKVRNHVHLKLERIHMDTRI